MKEILLINPRPAKKQKKRRGKTTGVKAMAEKKKTNKPRKRKKSTSTSSAPKRRRSYSKKTTTKRRRRRNPSPRSAVSSLFSLRGIMNTSKDAAQQFGGKLACQFAAKKFAEGGGANEDWSWKNYLFGFIGTGVAGFAAEMIKRGSGHQFITGGLSYIFLKAFVGELGPRSAWVQTYFGAPEDYGYGTGVSGSLPGQYRGTDGNMYNVGDSYYGEDGEVYLLGADGYWRPTSDDYRNPALLGFGDGMNPKSALGDAVVPVGPLGADPYQMYFNRLGDGDPYSQTFFRN